MLALLLPGRRHPVDLFAVVTRVLRERGHDVHEVHWDASHLDAPVLAEESDGHEEWVRAQAAAAVAETGEPGLVVGKSLGTWAAALAGERGWPAVWLTPLLTQDACVDGLRTATAPRLLVGGTADPWWDVDTASALSADGAQVAQHEHADHGLLVDGALVDLEPDLGAYLDRL